MASVELPSFSSLILDNRRELAVLIFLGILLGYAFYYYLSLTPAESPISDESGVIHLDEIKVNDFVDNRKGWQLRGKTAVVLEDTKRMRIEQIEISISSPIPWKKSLPHSMF